MLIEVTQKHIKEGIRKDARNCPLALALEEAFDAGAFSAFEGAKDPISREHYYATVDGHYFMLDQNLNNWIRGFDKTGVAEPITVELKGDLCSLK